MSLIARSMLSTTADSLETGRTVASQITEGLESPPRLVITHLTMNHDQESYLRGVREVVGDEVSVIGCSAQGVVATDHVREGGFAATAMALGGEGISAASGKVDQIAVDTAAKGGQLGRALLEGSTEKPKVVVLYYDPLSGVNIETFVAALATVVDCPIVGGASSHSFLYEELQQTFQYYDGLVATHSAVAFALCGQLETEIAACHGCSEVGVELTVTRAANNVLLELNNRRAIDVWNEICGPEFTHSSALAIGIAANGAAGAKEYLVRAAYAVSEETGGVVLGSAIPVGARIMLHHRGTQDVLEGARTMGEQLRARLQGRTVRAALAFECGARTRPFLGDEATLQENLELQRAVGPGVPWMGLMAWGEIYPVAGQPTFHNYAYPVLVLTD